MFPVDEVIMSSQMSVNLYKQKGTRVINFEFGFQNINKFP